MSKLREQAFLNGMVRVFRKLKRAGLSKERILKCLRIAWLQEVGYEGYEIISNIGKE